MLCRWGTAAEPTSLTTVSPRRSYYAATSCTARLSHLAVTASTSAILRLEVSELLPVSLLRRLGFSLSAEVCAHPVCAVPTELPAWQRLGVY